MKSNYLKLLIIETSLLLFSLFSINYRNFNYYIYLGFLSVFAIILSNLFIKELKKERFNTEILLLIVIIVLFYYASTYFIGFFSGFYYSNYSKSTLGITINITTNLLLIFSIENIRHTIIKNGIYYKSIIILIPIVCFFIELPVLISVELFISKIDMLNAILNLLIPCFVKNVVLTYITYKSNKNNSIIYRTMTEIPQYLLPVFPNLGEFYAIIVSILLPIIVLILSINISIFKREKIDNSRKLKINNYITNTISIIIIIVLFSMLYLTSNMFRFYSLAIGSESMRGTIDKGDMIIIDKKDKKIKNGDIIAFKEQEKIIVHRVVTIIDKENNIYSTKGDANKSKDSWLVTENMIVGKVKIRLKYLGWPTIALSELIQ